MFKQTTAIVFALLLSFATYSQLPAVAQLNPDPNRPVADKWAVVVGISKFQDESLNLKYAAKDARDFSDYLVREAHFSPDHVKLLVDEEATRENILALLGDKWLPRLAQPDDLVVIYISSHGSPSSIDVAGVNYVLAHNTDKESLYATGIEIPALARIVKRIRSDRVVVVLDACHSGAAQTDAKATPKKANVNADEIVQGTGQLVICSSAPDQTSWESKHYQNGVFTRHLIEGLKSKDRLGEAYTYVKEKVQTEVLQDRAELQVPMLKSKWEGKDLILAVPPAKPRTVPAELLVAHKPPTASPPIPRNDVEEPLPPIELPQKLTVLPVKGPLNMKLDWAWQKWCEEKGTMIDTKAERDEVANALRDLICQELNRKLPKGTLVDSPVSLDELDQDPAMFDVPIKQRELAVKANARYVVFVTFDELRLRDKLMSNVRTPGAKSDEYVVYVSAKLVSADKGTKVLEFKKRPFSVIPLVNKKDDDILKTLKMWLYPLVAKSISNEISTAIGR